MSHKIQEIQKKLAKLEKDAEDLKQLKSDYNYTKEFHKKLIKHKVD